MKNSKNQTFSKSRNFRLKNGEKITKIEKIQILKKKFQKLQKKYQNLKKKATKIKKKNVPKIEPENPIYIFRHDFLLEFQKPFSKSKT